MNDAPTPTLPLLDDDIWLGYLVDIELEMLERDAEEREQEQRRAANVSQSSPLSPTTWVGRALKERPSGVHGAEDTLKAYPSICSDTAKREAEFFAASKQDARRK